MNRKMEDIVKWILLFSKIYQNSKSAKMKQKVKLNESLDVLKYLNITDCRQFIGFNKPQQIHLNSRDNSSAEKKKKLIMLPSIEKLDYTMIFKENVILHVNNDEKVIFTQFNLLSSY